jgi:hypothetical protein
MVVERTNPSNPFERLEAASRPHRRKVTAPSTAVQNSLLGHESSMTDVNDRQKVQTVRVCFPTAAEKEP